MEHRRDTGHTIHLRGKGKVNRSEGQPQIKALKQFKKISTACSALSDPNKRRQCDFSRVFKALFNKLGDSIPTQIVPKVVNNVEEEVEWRRRSQIAEQAFCKRGRDKGAAEGNVE
ncbi:hypothetical protein OSTOST_02560 [Ostertagia ostertagi]